MKHINLFNLFLLLVLPQLAFAQQISEGEAMNRAMSFFAEHSTSQSGIKKAPSQGNSNQVTLAYTARKDGNTCFYVYNRGNNDGFVIVGGDAVAHEILAYVPQGHFNYDSIPDNVKWWLDEYAREISVVKKMKPQARPTSASRNAARPVKTPSVEDLFTDIPDLISTKWDQGAPYNAAIPAIHHTNGDSVVPPTGCVPTAMAQIMNYWQWPTTGVGSYSYTLDYSTLDEESAGVNPGDYDGWLPATFSADFGNTTYDWANMADIYDGTNSQAQIDAVSTLMYHAGVAEYTLYGNGGSGGGIDRAMTALKQYFRYSNRMTYLNRGDYLDDEWEEIIYSELLAGRPVYYESKQHAFVLHGYSANYKMFSVNWGWGGFMDGYWKITGTDYAYFVNDENVNLDFIMHGICIHIVPDNIVHSNNFSNVGDTIVVDGIRYDLIGPLSKTVEVTFAPNDEIIYEGELTIPDTIVYNNEKYTVTKIGRYGLANGGSNYYGILMGGVTNLTGLHLPNTLRSIAMGGLSDCRHIKVLQIPEGVKMLGEQCFKSMVSLKSITLPSQLPYIPHYCFWECKGLETITLPASIKALGYYSFYDCPSLSALISNAVEVPSHNTTPGYTAAFDQDLTGRTLAVPQVAIDDYRNDPVFGLWGKIIPIDSLPTHFGKLFTIDDIQYKVLASGEGVSAYNYVGDGQDTLIIPSSIVYDTLTYSVKAIASTAFKELQNVKTIIIKDGVEEIGEYSFQESLISSISLPATLKTIKRSAFSNCQMLTSVYLPNGIATIEPNAFAGSWHIQSIEIPNSVVNIGGGIFEGCDNLEYVKLSSSITELPAVLFWRTKIKSIVLPSGITNINYGCFRECDSLNTMVCYATEVPLLEELSGWPIFPSNIAQGTLYVPAESVSAYQSAPGWQDWGTILPIVPVDSIHLEDISIGKLLFDTISIQVFPSNVTEGQIFYSSSNPKIAKIDKYGIITAVEVGETTITAETMDGKSATCTVTVSLSQFIASGRSRSVWWTLSKDSILNVFGSGIFDSYSSRFEYYRAYVKEAYISEGITLEYGALGWCNNLTKVELPTAITNIPDYAFYADENLREINLPSSVSSIGNQAFGSCYHLSHVTIPGNVTSIGEEAFMCCFDLQQIVCRSTTPPTTNNSFVVCPSTIPVYVPCGSAESYRGDAGWSYFTNIVESNYYISVSSENISVGYTTITKLPDCESDTAIVEAHTTYGYIFSHWSDGNTENPRTIVLHSDTALTAYFVRGYYVSFYDENGSLLQRDAFEYGSMPVYTGPTPTKADDEHYTYTFEGWTPEIVAVTGDATYTASYLATPIGEGSGFEDVEGESTPQKALIGDQIYILRGDRVYTLQGQEVR